MGEHTGEGKAKAEVEVWRQMPGSVPLGDPPSAATDLDAPEIGDSAVGLSKLLGVVSTVPGVWEPVEPLVHGGGRGMGEVGSGGSSGVVVGQVWGRHVDRGGKKGAASVLERSSRTINETLVPLPPARIPDACNTREAMGDKQWIHKRYATDCDWETRFQSARRCPCQLPMATGHQNV